MMTTAQLKPNTDILQLNLVSWKLNGMFRYKSNAIDYSLVHGRNLNARETRIKITTITRYTCYPKNGLLINYKWHCTSTNTVSSYEHVHPRVLHFAALDNRCNNLSSNRKEMKRKRIKNCTKSQQFVRKMNNFPVTRFNQIISEIFQTN